MKEILSPKCLREKQSLTNISFIIFKYKLLEYLNCFHSGAFYYTSRSEVIINIDHTTGHHASFYLDCALLQSTIKINIFFKYFQNRHDARNDFYWTLDRLYIKIFEEDTIWVYPLIFWSARFHTKFFFKLLET